MKASRILIFILAVFALLGFLGYAMPTDGLNVGAWNFKFPSFSEIMKGNAEECEPEPEEEKIAPPVKQLTEAELRRIDALNAQYAINFPNNEIEWMDDVFAAFENASNKPVRVPHYGDSQIEEDRMTSTLRAKLQGKFGGYGVGLVPAVQSIATSAIGRSNSIELPNYMVYGGNTTEKLESRRYGVLGQASELYGSCTFSFYRVRLKTTQPTTQQFANITVLLDEVTTPVTASVRAGRHTQTKNAGPGDHYIKFNLPDSTARASLTLSGNMIVQGFILDGSINGIAVDNAAMRGCSGTIFTSINSESLRLYYSKYNVPLIILQYGGNSVPYVKSDKNIATYCHSITRQIDYLKRISPKSKIMFVGPSDMATNVNGTKQTYPHLPKLIKSLKDSCNAHGAAYWDLYKAMGGKNSMAKWAKSSPRLAGSDHIHFTPLGASKAGEMIYDGIMSAYEFYEYRKANKK